MTIRGILFDIGDTLLDATRLQRRALKESLDILAAENLIDSPEEFLRAYRLADEEPQFEDMPDLNHLYSDSRIVVRAFQILSKPFTSQVIDNFLRVYRDRIRANVRPDTALKSALDELKQMGIKLGIVSNGTTKEQLEQLALLQIRDYFDPILISEEVGIRKPDPRIFLLAVKKWQLSPDKILVVGDRGDWEIVGAHYADMKSALTTQFVDHRDAVSEEMKPDFIISDISELPHILKNYNDAEAVGGS